MFVSTVALGLVCTSSLHVTGIVVATSNIVTEPIRPSLLVLATVLVVSIHMTSIYLGVAIQARSVYILKLDFVIL